MEGLRLSFPTEGNWIDVGNGAALFSMPPTSIRVMAARGNADALLIDIVAGQVALTKAGGEVSGIAAPDDDAGMEALSEVLFLICLAEQSINDWRNILDDEGNQLEFDSSRLAGLMMHPNVSQKWQNTYLKPINMVASEGNV